MVKKSVKKSNHNNAYLVLGILLGVVLVYCLSTYVFPQNNTITGFATNDDSKLERNLTDVESCEPHQIGNNRCSNGKEQTCESTRDGGQWSAGSSCQNGCDRLGAYCRCSPGANRCLTTTRLTGEGYQDIEVNQQCDQYGEWHSDEGNACSSDEDDPK